MREGTVLYDALGPRGQARVRVASTASAVVVLGLLALAAKQLYDHDFFQSHRWVDALDQLVFVNTYVPGLLRTCEAAVLGGVFALAIGFVVGLGRISEIRPVRSLSTWYVQFFRAMPALLLIWIPFLIALRGNPKVDGFYFVVLGLALYNGAVLAEILRSGVNALEAGQAMAGYAVGLSRLQVMRYVVLPQAVRNMLPAILAQLVILFKDTSLGYIVIYHELLLAGKSVGETYPESLLQGLIVVSFMYFVIAFGLSRLVHRIEIRMRRSKKTDTPKVKTTEIPVDATL
jgi:glutamate transport system permease protein